MVSSQLAYHSHLRYKFDRLIDYDPPFSLHLSKPNCRLQALHGFWCISGLWVWRYRCFVSLQRAEFVVYWQPFPHPWTSQIWAVHTDLWFRDSDLERGGGTSLKFWSLKSPFYDPHSRSLACVRDSKGLVSLSCSLHCHLRHLQVWVWVRVLGFCSWA